MGTGTDAARAAGNVAHADAIDNMKDQLLIVLIKRLLDRSGGGDTLTIPVAEVDDVPGNFLLAFNLDIDARAFNFVLQAKQ